MQPTRQILKIQWAAQPMPIADIHGRVGIGVRLVSATAADVGMFFTIIDRATVVAGLAGVVGANLVDGHTGLNRLVGHEGFKLKERPIVPILTGVRFGFLALFR